MKKDDLERVFRSFGTVPVLREKMGAYDLYVADGFSKPPHIRLQKFGIEPDDFPNGMFVTVWWIGKDETLLVGQPIFFELTEIVQKSRINAARRTAADEMLRFKKRKLH